MSETRDFGHVEWRAIEGDEHAFTARVLNYGQVDRHGTTFAPGVFTRSLEEHLPTAVWSHDKNRPIGRVTAFRDSPEGLDVDVRLADFDAVPDAKMAHALLRDGILDGFSFAFSPVTKDKDPNHRGATRFTEAEIFEVSPVIVPSGKGTRTISVRDTSVEVVPVQHRAMIETPHSYRAAGEAGSICEVCGGAQDNRVHMRSGTAEEIHTLALELATAGIPAERSTDELIETAQFALETAIGIASVDSNERSVAQMVALVMTAHRSLESAITQLDTIASPEGTDELVRELVVVPVVEAGPDTQIEDALAKLNRAAPAWKRR